MGILATIKKVWKALDYVPDCPECHGTGEPTGFIDATVYWKGKQVRVCGTCMGAGKV